MNDHALFAVAPLVSIVVLVVAVTLRFVHDHSVRMRPLPSVSAARRAVGRHWLPAIGFFGVLLGHVVMVAWPNQLLSWGRDLPRLVAFELALFMLGVAALVGVGAAIRRRVLRRIGDGAGLADAAFVGVLLLTVVSGLGIAVFYRWAAAWSAVTVTRYARSLLSLQPNLEALEGMPYLVKLHIFSSFIVITLLAFTRFIDVFLCAVRRTASWVFGPVVSTFDFQWRLLHKWALRSGRSLMPPEEEDES
jgi:nitrate reductase gamma subunit